MWYRPHSHHPDGFNTVEFSLRCQQNKNVDVFAESCARKYTIWLVQELLREKRRIGRNGDVGREICLVKNGFSHDINI